MRTQHLRHWRHVRHLRRGVLAVAATAEKLDNITDDWLLRVLGERMRRRWIAFVRTGQPGEGWPRYTPQMREVMLFDLCDRVVADPEPARRAAWGAHELVAAPL